MESAVFSTAHLHDAAIHEKKCEINKLRKKRVQKVFFVFFFFLVPSDMQPAGSVRERTTNNKESATVVVDICRILQALENPLYSQQTTRSIGNFASDEEEAEEQQQEEDKHNPTVAIICDYYLSFRTVDL